MPEGGKDGPSAQERLDQHGFFRISYGGRARSESRRAGSAFRVYSSKRPKESATCVHGLPERNLIKRLMRVRPATRATSPARIVDPSKCLGSVAGGAVRFDVLVQPRP